MKIDFKKTGVSSLIQDYLSEKENLKLHYHRFPHKAHYALQAKEKLNTYEHREVLHKVLTKQLFGLDLSPKQRANLEKLKNPHTLTVTTGHQLNLLTGPLYFIYKILHTIKICDELNQHSTSFDYVPIYWMATEDHDFKEINHFHTYKNTYSFNAKEGGFVGDICTREAQEVLSEYIQSLPHNNFGKELKELIENSYLDAENLAQASKKLVHQLLGKYGILILDGNDSDLKKLMIPYFKQELLHHLAQEKITETNKALEQYKQQAYAREINLFFLYQNKRERIELIKDKFVLSESKKDFTPQELLSILNDAPERFSPNVILRPLYQEVILPNVAYVGGGGEISYWLQLKGMFDAYGVIYPMLVLRNSMLVLPNAMLHKAESLNLLPYKIFEPRFKIKREQATANSSLFQKVNDLKSQLENNFDELEAIAQKTGDDFAQMVEAQKKKQLNGFEKLNQRLNLSEQKQQKALMHKIDEIYDFMYPNNQWQERVINFSEFYKTSGDTFFDDIYEAMDAFNSSYHLLTLDSILK